jgi:outer membrane receptor protein involved in Fe transport
MFTTSKLSNSVRLALIAGATAAPLLVANPAMAEENTEQKAEGVEKIAVTGSRIRRPGAVSTSPIMSMDAEDISFLQEPEVEKIIRLLPGTTPGDGANANNGSAGAATVNLRGLGPERTLVLMNGRRMVPYNYDGEVDTATIPTALIERVDVVTGGASAVYGSDAVSGAVNFILKENFEGVAFEYNHSQTAEEDGNKNSLSLTLGANLDDDRGNIALSMSWMQRDQVLLGDRPLGLLGINTSNGNGLDQFRAGEPPVAPIAGCGGPNVVDLGAGGSTTAIPTRFQIVGGGAAAGGQFRDDGTIGDQCSRFNFNPFNFYQTPQERYSATVIGHYDINDSVRAYATATFSNVTVDTQVAPSGTFGASFDLPLSNPYIGDQARQFMIDAGNNALAEGLLSTGADGGFVNWNDVNANGVVDVDDYLKVQLRRRTLELGPRSERYDSDQFQLVTGFKGDLQFIEDWEFDASFAYAESNRVTTRGGYTNLTNIQNALDSYVAADGSYQCRNGDSTCVPINLFGGFGTITDDMAQYAMAVALQTQKYDQTVGQIIFNGPVEALTSPLASDSLEMSIGYEYRQERGSLNPDECLRLAPASCQGGAGGNLLPITGGYKADEFFVEGILPIAQDQDWAQSLDLEMGYRNAEYDSVGSVNTWKLGFSYKPSEDWLMRVMWQSATRAPNVGEIASPVVTGLDNALMDPCSIANAGNISDTLSSLCQSTGMTAAQVGSVQDIISGQISTFDGSDPANLPGAEDAKTFTAGVVYTADFLKNFSVSLDYYDIDISDVIGEFSAQEVLDSCYVAGEAEACSKINRIGGTLTVAGSGIELYTTNLNFRRAEGLEFAMNFDYDMRDMGELSFSTTINHYLTNERQSSATSSLIDCNGIYGTSCNPVSKTRWLQRVTWSLDDYTASLLWRYQGELDIAESQRAGVFEEFRSIDAYNYVDFYASYNWGDNMKFTFGIDNLFDKEPPIVGNEAGSTQYNSGNTFPSNYSVLGRIYKAGFKIEF